MPHEEEVGFDELVGEDQVGFDELVGDEVIGADRGHVDPDVAALLAAGDDVIGASWQDLSRDLLRRARAATPARQPARVGLPAPMVRRPVPTPALTRWSLAEAMRRVSHPVVVRRVDPDRKLRIPAGFAALGVQPGGQATITIRPQTLYRAEELIIPELFGQNFNIVSLTIGQISLLTGSGIVPALMFSEKSLRACNLDFPTNQPTQEILMIVVNTAASPKDLQGAFYGRAAF